MNEFMNANVKHLKLCGYIRSQMSDSEGIVDTQSHTQSLRYTNKMRFTIVLGLFVATFITVEGCQPCRLVRAKLIICCSKFQERNFTSQIWVLEPSRIMLGDVRFRGIAANDKEQ